MMNTISDSLMCVFVSLVCAYPDRVICSAASFHGDKVYIKLTFYYQYSYILIHMEEGVILTNEHFQSSTPV